MSKKKNNNNNRGGGGSSKQKQAVQRAQAFISGNTLNRSEVKKLENKGFSSKVIQAVASSANKVGTQAQARVDRKHAPGAQGGGSRTVRVVGGDSKVKVDGQGQLVVSSPRDRFGASPQFGVTQKQANKVNREVEKVDGSLKPGPGMAVSRYVTIRTPAVRNPMAFAGGGANISPAGKRQLAIYAPVSRPGGRGDNDNGNSGGGGSQGSARDRERMSSARSAYKRAQRRISGTTSAGSPPGMYPNGTTPGRAVEDVANYADRLGAYNANYSGWMQDRAEADRHRSGTMLERFANITPKVPDTFSAKNMIDMANRMNRQIKIG